MPEAIRNVVDDVLVATSISPRDLTRQIEALRSWKAAGFELHSLNDPSEVSALADVAAASDIPVVPTPVTAYFGKPLLPVDAFISYFRTQDRPRRFFGIINSDIALVDADRLMGAFHQPASLIFGRRGDVDGPGDRAGVAFGNGYDFFFLSRDAVWSLPESRFRVGAPWWDYWLPVTQLLAGRRAVQVTPPVATHRRHDVAWNGPIFNEMGLHLFERLMFMRNTSQTDPAMDFKLYTRVLQNMLNRVADIESEHDGALRIGLGKRKRILPAIRSFRRVLMRGEERPDTPFATYALRELSRSLLELIDVETMSAEGSVPLGFRQTGR